MKRIRLLKWLRVKVFKCKEGEIAPQSLMFIYSVLFPLAAYCERQTRLNYDPLTDIYTINGMKFSGIIFEVLKDHSQKGQSFRLIETGDVATIEFLPKQSAHVLITEN